MNERLEVYRLKFKLGLEVIDGSYNNWFQGQETLGELWVINMLGVAQSHETLRSGELTKI